MKIEDVKVGQKVIIKNKSVWNFVPFDEYLTQQYGASGVFKTNGFAYVTGFDEDEPEVIIVGGEEDLESGQGDYFIAEDLELYNKPQGHINMAKQAFFQFKVLTQVLESEQISEMFDYLVDATSNYIIEKLGLDREDFITTTVDDSLRERCTFDELLDKLGVDVD